MLIIFTVKDQKVTHDLGQRTLVAGSSGVVQAAFTFDSSWDGLDVVVVFSNSGKKCSNKPVKYDGAPIDIPPEVLIAGKLYVSVIGFGDSGPERQPRNGTCNRLYPYTRVERLGVLIFSETWLKVLCLKRTWLPTKRSSKCLRTCLALKRHPMSLMRGLLLLTKRMSPPTRR